MTKITINNKTDFKKLQKQLEKDLNKKFETKVIIGKFRNEYMKQLRQNLNKFKKTGNLYKSFRSRVFPNKLVISSNSPYAAIQNHGGRIKITEKMRKAMWALFYETGNAMYKAIALTKKSFIVLKGKDYINININDILNKILKNTK